MSKPTLCQALTARVGLAAMTEHCNRGFAALNYGKPDRQARWQDLQKQIFGTRPVRTDDAAVRLDAPHQHLDPVDFRRHRRHTHTQRLRLLSRRALHAKDDLRTKYLVDFWVVPKDGKLTAIEERIYKAPYKNGNSWTMMQRQPKPWWLIPAAEHPGETEQKRSGR